MLAIKNNLMAEGTARSVGKSYDALAQSVQRLSSGLRINGAADDAAGLAVRDVMRADIAVLKQGARNAQDGISLLQTAEGALEVVDELLVRMKELAEQAATESYSSDQLAIMDDEFQAMLGEIDRIAAATKFNGIELINDATATVHIHFGTSNTADDAIDVTLVDEDKFRETDKFIGDIAGELEPRGYSSREFMEILGSRIDDEGSILYNAVKYGVPVIVPALNDSSIGIGLTGLYYRRRMADQPFMRIDPIRDNWEMTQLKIHSEKTAVIYIGGGVPKNYIQQTEVICETLGYDRGGHHYAVQITQDAPQWGGLSGCTFEEAQSWGKINRDANKSVAYVEASIGLSLIVGYILQSGAWKDRKRLKYTWNDDMLTKVDQVPLDL